MSTDVSGFHKDILQKCGIYGLALGESTDLADRLTSLSFQNNT